MPKVSRVECKSYLANTGRRLIEPYIEQTKRYGPPKFKQTGITVSDALFLVRDHYQDDRLIDAMHFIINNPDFRYVGRGRHAMMMWATVEAGWKFAATGYRQ